MPNQDGVKTEEDVVPHSKAWVIFFFIAIVMLAALCTGLWYFFGTNTHKKAPEIPSAVGTSVGVNNGL